MAGPLDEVGRSALQGERGHHIQIPTVELTPLKQEQLALYFTTILRQSEPVAIRQALPNQLPIQLGDQR